MSEASERPGQGEDALRRAVLAMRQMRGRVETLEAEHAGAIAVVGMGCRYPGGVNSPDSYWQLIEQGRDALGEIPEDRWEREAFYDPDPDVPGRMYTKRGGFIDETGRRFDASFFGISPREAVATDPQHRLLLEVSWEALENAGQPPDDLVGSRTGVFIGISTNDYAELRYDCGGRDAIDPYWGLGNSPSFAAGRLAYTLGLQGPVVPVDTACSSSLVATHLAMQALRRRECDMALAGGVNLIMSPSLMIYFCKLRALSANGQCRTFDAGADGYVRGEGCGMLVLKRLEDAQSSGDSIIGVLRGSAVAHNGRSGGITIPNGPSQQAVIRRAMEESGYAAADVGYVEAHGTATPLGDPIEMQALAATYGKAQRTDGPLAIGSVKTQIGHLEAAAGVAGLSRALLALQHRKMPAHLHFDKLNPHIESLLEGRFDYRFAVAGEAWAKTSGPRVAAVSSFGINGTNAHIVLEEAPCCPTSSDAPVRSEILILSAKSADALVDLVRNYTAWLQDASDLTLADVCHTAAVGRAHFRERLAVCCDSLGDLAAKLEDWLHGSVQDSVQTSVASTSLPPPLAMIFPARAERLERMERELTTRFAVFREALASCGAAPRLFALQYALCMLWRDWNVQPQTVIGYGMGRVSAAFAAGALSHEDAVALAIALDQGRTLPASIEWRQSRVAWLEGGTGRRIDDGGKLDWHLAAEEESCTLPEGTLALKICADDGAHPDRMLVSALARLYVAGLSLDWRAADRPGQRRILALPTYPFQRKEYWDAAVPKVVGAMAHGAADSVINVLRPVWKAAALGKSLRKLDRVHVLFRAPAQIEAASIEFAANGIDVLPLMDAGTTADGRALVRRPGWNEPELLEPLIEYPLADLRFLGPESLELTLPAIELLPTLQALPQTAAGYWLATRHAFATNDSESADPASAALWGLLLSLREERPDLELGLVDVDGTDPTALITEMTAGLATGAPVAWRGGQRLERVLEPVAKGKSAPLLRPEATYLVTGGLGGIGQKLIRWLATRGAKHITVPSRRGAVDERARALDDLARDGVVLDVVECDLTDLQAVATLITGITHSRYPLAGVFHASGVTHDALIQDQSADTVVGIMAPKAVAALVLHELTRALPLDYFVLFSSMAGAIGSAGQSTYAAANAALAALADTRRAGGLPALCIDWGLWDGAGMGAALTPQDRARLLRRGIRPMNPATALDYLGAAMCGTDAHQIIGSFAFSPQQQPDPAGDWKSRIERAQGAERDSLIADCLSAGIGQVLGLPSNQVKAEDNLFEIGFDSLMVMDLVKLLKKELGCVLYPRELYQTPMVGNLAAYLVKELGGGSDEATKADLGTVANPVWTQPSVDNDVAAEPVPGIGLILSAPRSGSTLLRVMLAGHSSLFVPPELHLLPFSTMADRASRLADSHLDEGLIRALMELRQCRGDVARTEVEAMIQAGTPVQEVYRLLHREAQDRLVIDKSPSYATHLDTLLRAERFFHAPRYVHLVRHPVAMIGSFVRMRMDRLIGVQEGDPTVLAESIWRDMNRNVLALAQRVGPDRCLLMRYEDLVGAPEQYGRKICEFLGVEFAPALLEPYSGARMTDGISDRSLSVGDPDFNAHHTIEPALADAWREDGRSYTLAQSTADLARELGYEVAEIAQARRQVSPSPMRESTIRGNGIDLTVCQWGEVQAPAVICLHGLLEQGAVFAPVAALLVEAGFQVIAPDLRGHGKSGHVAPCSGYQLTDFVADLSALVGQMSSTPVTLLGVSMGAAIAAVFAAARPEMVSGLVLVEPPVLRRADTSEALSILRAQLLSGGTNASRRAMPDCESAARRLMELVPSLDSKMAGSLAERGTIRKDDAVHWRWDPRLRAPAGIGSTPGVDDVLGHLRVPHMLLFGRDGELVHARDWHEGCTRHLREIVELPGGHFLHLDASAAVSQAICDINRGMTEVVPMRHAQAQEQ